MVYNISSVHISHFKSAKYIQDLVHELNILREATQNLIVQFLSAVGDLQSTQDSGKLGTIFVSITYLRDSGSVSLEMIQAVDLRSDSRVSQSTTDCVLSTKN